MEDIKRVARRFYSHKSIITTIRLDRPTLAVLEVMKRDLGVTGAEALRLSLWIVAILLDPSTTLRQVLSPEAVEKLKKGEDVSVVDALSPLGKLLEEWMERYVKAPKA
jgi:hypothetical protein